MKFPLLLTALVLSTSLLAVTPMASANHCGQYPLVQEAYCTVDERTGVNGLIQRGLCFYYNAPYDWYSTCIF